MKTIAIFFPLVSLFLLFLPPQKLEAAPQNLLPGTKNPLPYTLSLSASSGLLYGRGEEIVYKDTDRDAFLSELLWDLKPLFYLGTGLEFAPVRPLDGGGLWASLSFQFGIPGEAGIIEDRDWLNPQEDFLTHYSRHEAFGEAFLAAGFRGGFSIPLFSRLVLRGALGVFYQRLKWTAHDGYIQYRIYDDTQAWDPSLDQDPLSGPGIAYAQEWLVFFPALSLGSSLGNLFSWELGGALSPLVYGTARDDHFLGKTQDFDCFPFALKGGLFLEGRGELTFRPRTNLALTLHAAFKMVRGNRGESYRKNTGISAEPLAHKSANEVGGGLAFLDTGLSLQLSL